jgi:hypothetical protein
VGARNRIILGSMEWDGTSAEPQDRFAERRQAWRRLRWRMRGAWQWPTFFAMTLVDGAVLSLLPFYGDGPGGMVPGVLLAGFLNLLAVAVLAPLCGLLLRRRRPDLPRLVASNYAGTALLTAFGVLLVVGGVLHLPATAATERDRRAVLASVHDFVLTQRPALSSRLAATDLMQVEPRLYRACVPKPQPRRWMCLFVSTDQTPPGVTRDHDQEANDAYRVHGGFR